MGRRYWEPLLEFARGTMLSEGTISSGEIDYFLTDEPAVAVEHIRRLEGRQA